MLTIKNAIRFIVVLILSVFIFSSCVSKENTLNANADGDKKQSASIDKKENSGEINVAVILKAKSSDYWRIVEIGAKQAAKELGVKVEVLGPNIETDITGQSSIIEEQINRSVSVLVVSPSQTDSLITAFDKADIEGIPVLLIDTDAVWKNKKSFIGTDNRSGGKLAGEYISKRTRKGDKVVIIRGALGDITHDERTLGAMESMEEAGLELFAVQPANSDTNMAKNVMHSLLQTSSDIKAVFCTNDEMALGAVKAIEETDIRGITVIGFDGSPDALISIKEGTLTGSVAQNPYNIGKLGVEAAVKAAKGEKVEVRVDTGTRLITSENVDKELNDLNQILKK